MEDRLRWVAQDRAAELPYGEASNGAIKALLDYVQALEHELDELKHRVYIIEETVDGQHGIEGRRSSDRLGR